MYEFINIIEKAYEKTYEYLNIKKGELEDLNDKIFKNESLSENEKSILWLLAQVEVFKGEKPSIKLIADFINVSEPTARKSLNSLLDKKLIKEEKESKNKIYSILDL